MEGKRKKDGVKEGRRDVEKGEKRWSERKKRDGEKETEKIGR